MFGPITVCEKMANPNILAKIGFLNSRPTVYIEHCLNTNTGIQKSQNQPFKS